MTAQPNQSLRDGIILLGLLCSSGRLGTTEAAQRLGWEVTRVNRLLGTLRNLGLAEQNASRKYIPGPGIHLLAAQCLQGSGLLAAALPTLAAADRAGFGIALGVLWRGSVCYLLHAEPGEPLDSGLREFKPYPADQSGIGIILEAFTDQEEPRNPPAVLAKARGQGFAVAIQPDGVRGTIAVAVPGGAGRPPLAGLAWFGDLSGGDHAALADRLHAQAALISAAHRQSFAT